MFKKAKSAMVKHSGEAMNNEQKDIAEKKQTRIMLIILLVLCGLIYQKVSKYASQQTTVLVPYGAKSSDMLITGESASTGYVRQLARLFGPEAGAPRATLFKDWAADPFTATADDAQAGEHPLSGGLAPAPAEWRQRLWLAGSEAARRDAGYLAGAVEAAEYAVAALIERRVSAP